MRQKQEEYPTVKIDHLSSDGLWEMARTLSLQQRAEVLGAPTGYEHLFLVPGASSEEVRNALENSWFVLIQDTLAPINLRAVVDALQPDHPFGAPIFVRPVVAGLPWHQAAKYQGQIIDEVLAKSRDLLYPRFAVFSLAQIPLAMHLGFLLSDRVEVHCYQYDRDRRSWRWPAADTVAADSDIRISGLPTERVQATVEVAVRVSLSAEIASVETAPVLANVPIQIDISVANPNVMWLRSPDQLLALGQAFREVLTNIRSKIPSCSRIHLFYAGPTGGAIVIGQQINPRMNPTVDVYEYSRQTSPRYQYALTLPEVSP